MCKQSPFVALSFSEMDAKSATSGGDLLRSRLSAPRGVMPGRLRSNGQAGSYRSSVGLVPTNAMTQSKVPRMSPAIALVFLLLSPCVYARLDTRMPVIRQVRLPDGMRGPVSAGCDTLPMIDVLKAQ